MVPLFCNLLFSYIHQWFYLCFENLLSAWLEQKILGRQILFCISFGYVPEEYLLLLLFCKAGGKRGIVPLWQWKLQQSATDCWSKGTVGTVECHGKQEFAWIGTNEWRKNSWCWWKFTKRGKKTTVPNEERMIK